MRPQHQRQSDDPLRLSVPTDPAAALASRITDLSHEFALICDLAGTVTWVDDRVARMLQVEAGTSLRSLAVGLNEEKLDRFLAEAQVRRIDGWELVLLSNGTPSLFSATGAPFEGGVLVAAMQVPNLYQAAFEQFGEMMNRLATVQREAVRHEQELALAHRELIKKSAELERLNQLVAETARIDALTGLGNRRRLDEDLATLDGRAKRYGHRYSVALCDIDHFKLYNDRYGHLAGDEALRAVGQALAAHARSGDGVYRYGGEEFLLVFPEQTDVGALRATEGSRRAVYALQIPHASHPGVGVVTMSAGVATFRPGDDGGYEPVLARADAALYLAKARGRNRVEREEAVNDLNG